MEQRIRNLVAWAQGIPPRKVDAGLVLLVLAEGAVEASVPDVAAGTRAAFIALVAVIAGAVWMRRRSPVAAMFVGLAALTLLGVLPKRVTDQSGGPYLVVLFLIFSMALRTEGRRLALAAVAGLCFVELAIAVDRYDDGVDDLLFAPALFIVAPVAVGQMLRSRNRLTRTLREKARRAEDERDRHARTAVDEERARIAGELHDVVAHALGAMTVQASAARRLVATDHERASEAFGAVEATGRDALGELRALLGVLRREDEDLALAPQPRLANLPDLIRRTEAAGLGVELAVEGEPPPTLPAGIDLTAYRVVQEALGSALRVGGAGRARVRVRYSPEGVAVEITDDGTADVSRELLGVRERVRVYGGSLATGAPGEAGHRVRARLPVGSAG